MKRTSIAGAAALALGCAWSANAANDDVAAQRLAANCTGCHGPAGASAGAIPSIAGLEADYFSAAMRAFRDGSRQATVMHQHAKGYDDREIDLLAKYFASQKRP